MKKFLLLSGLALITVLYWQPYRLTLVHGPSMTPTIASGSLLVFDRNYYSSHPLCKGDIVIFRHEDELYLKRVYALPGDEVIQLRTPGTPDSIVRPEQADRLARAVMRQQPNASLVKVRVPPGYVYMLGDGGMLSRDSRDFGPIAQNKVNGKIVPLFKRYPDIPLQTPFP